MKQSSRCPVGQRNHHLTQCHPRVVQVGGEAQRAGAKRALDNIAAAVADRRASKRVQQRARN